MIGECESCGFEDIELEPYRMNRNFPKKIEDKVLCFVCANSMLGVAYEYPEQYKDFQVMKLIGYCTNLLLKEIRRANEKK